MLSAALRERIDALQAQVQRETGQPAEVRVFLADGRSVLAWPDGQQVESDGKGRVQLVRPMGRVPARV